MISLSDALPFSSGGNRDCYENPVNPNTCIKVTKHGITKKIKKNTVWYKKFRSLESFDDNLREESGYRQKAISSLFLINSVSEACPKSVSTIPYHLAK